MWNFKPEERLREWKSFRNNLSQLELEPALEAVCKLWSYAPYVNHYLSPDLPEEWPDPWTLVHENYYCDLAKSLGMFYTLYLCHHYGRDIQQLELEVYRNSQNAEWHYIVSINKGKYILNLVFNTIVNKSSITRDLVLKHQYNVEDLKLDLY